MKALQKQNAKTKYTDREVLSEEQMEELLEECAQEPIHIPNSIQPHGVLIVTAQDDDEIVQISNNCKDFIDIAAEDAIGKSLKQILGETSTDRLESIIRNHDLQPLRSTLLTIAGNDYDTVVHYSNDYKVIELEPRSDNDQNEKLNFDERAYEDLRDFTVRLQYADKLENLYDILVEKVREMTGFARVKLYKFDEEWNGMVVAETRAEHMPSYLGLNFPASDIPRQARELYSRSYLRLIADTRYKPVPLYPQFINEDKKPLDMSYSILRSVSPVHIQYLENIDIYGSMSISIILNGKLWGLVACHHDAPKMVPYRSRVLAELTSHIFSAKLSIMELSYSQRRSAKKSLLIEKIASQINSALKANDILQGNQEIALEAMAADGLILKTGDLIQSYGSTPSEDIIEGYLEWCREHLKGEIEATRNAEKLLSDYEPAQDLKISGGFLAIPIGVSGCDVAIWLREAKVEKVKWAGNPEKSIEQTVGGHRLTPRKSFELWQTTTSGKCDDWTKDDIDAGRSIAQLILENDKIHAQQANAAKSEFLSQISHELRTPLGAITGIIRILNQDKDLSDKQKDLIRTLGISAESLLDLINDLLDISKIEAKEISLEQKEFDLAHILEDIRSMMKVKAGEKKLALNINYDSCLPYKLIGDPSKIKQILINLVNNAIKFTKDGFVNVMATCEERDKDFIDVKFEVIDTGIGIADEKLESIFEKFTQEDESTSRQYGGTGLGLAISRNLVTLMGGEISVTSKKGMGSRFTFDIPMHFKNHEIEKKETAHAPHHEHKKGEKRKRILLVEDYEGNIVVALYSLQEEGYEVVIANNGKEAIQKMEKEEFDLVIMDVQMPIMDGLTATRIIREKQANGEFKQTPILGMTANALTEDRDKCFAAGMDEYISKPFDFDDLSEKVGNLIWAR